MRGFKNIRAIMGLLFQEISVGPSRHRAMGAPSMEPPPPAKTSAEAGPSLEKKREGFTVFRGEVLENSFKAHNSLTLHIPSDLYYLVHGFLYGLAIRVFRRDHIY